MNKTLIKSGSDGMDIGMSNGDYNELLIGCGSNHRKKLYFGNQSGWENLVTLDVNPDHKPDIVWDLMNIPLPLGDNLFNEIHAYEVLEHTGQQGDYQFFFAQFSDFWRILKPNGLLMGSCPKPNTKWAFGDPSHTRVIQKENFVFLNQAEYTKQIGRTALSDFRYIYKADFIPFAISEEDDHLFFVLKAIKPSRISI
jgi:hypothetical protein